MPLPLEGIRVCDFTWIIAGPTASRVLADFGAEVIRIEHEQAVDWRPPRPPAGRWPRPTMNNSGFFNYFNRNKKSVLLNARHPNGMDVLKRLIAQCDIVVENFSSGIMASWGLDYEDLKAIKPDIIYCSISGFGHRGRDKDFVTWGPTAQALSGLTRCPACRDCRPPAGALATSTTTPGTTARTPSSWPSTTATAPARASTSTSPRSRLAWC